MAEGVTGRLGRRFWWVVRALAVAYPMALLLVVAAFRLVGEQWWVTTVTLYLPRLGFAVPWPVLTLVLLFGRAYRWLLTQVIAALILLFPLMGLHLSRPAAPTAGADVLRVVSLNIDEGRFGLANLIRHIRSVNPDLILMQEGVHADEEILRAGLSDYTFRKNDQFAVASRYPIVDVFMPPGVSFEGDVRSMRFVRYRIQARGGLIDVYDVHPISPRVALEDLRGAGLRHEILSGRIWSPASAEMRFNSQLRVLQVRTVVEEARRSTNPVLIAGDTNLPQLSWAYAQWLGEYQDAFAQRGSGFGYTFPAIKHAWMRIDRILAGPGFRFLTCAVMDERVSDHRGVIADVELPSRRPVP